MEVTDKNGRFKVEVTSIVTEIVIGTTTVAGGVSGRVLYDNAGIVGELDLSAIYVPTSRIISTTGPLSGGGDLSADRTLSIPKATTLVDGYLSAADWTIFNGKQATISLTTTGTGAATFISNVLNIPTPAAATFTSLTTTGSSGASTLIAGVLNIPTYTLAGLGGVPTSRTLTINGTTQDLSADRTFTISTGITIGTTAITSGTVGRVLFQGTGNVVSQSTNLFWDITNNRLGLGTSSPLARQHILTTSDQPLLINTSGNIEVAQFFGSAFVSTENYAGFRIIATTNGVPYIGLNTSSNVAGNVAGSQKAYIGYWGDDFGFASVGYSNGTHAIAWSTTTGNVKIGGVSNGKSTFTDAGYKLDVNGTARVQGLTTIRTLASSYNSPLIVENTGSAAVDNKNVATFIGARGNASNIDDNTNIGIWQKSNIVNNYGVVNYFNSGGNLAAYFGAQFVNHGASPTGNLLFGTVQNGAPSTRMTLFSTGNLAINTTTDVTSSKLTIESTTQGFLPPRMTTTQKNAIATPATGLVVFDLTLNKLCVRGASAWETITSL